MITSDVDVRKKESIKSLISLQDLSNQDIIYIINKAQAYCADVSRDSSLLQNKVIGTLFTKTSTRTRTAFSSGALRLGGQIISYGPNDLQLNTGENFTDTGAVLSRMIDALVVRTADDQNQMRLLASSSTIPIINAMSAIEHPTQALTDLSTILNKLGTLDGLKLLYMGEGNNSAAALALALAKFANVTLYLCCPPGYEVDRRVMACVKAQAQSSGSNIVELSDSNHLPTSIDIVYTTRWQTTGTVKHDPNWKTHFMPFQVTTSVIGNTQAKFFMHDLPAHRGEEVVAEVIDGPKSIVFNQAAFKMYSAMAIYNWLFNYNQ